MDWTATILAATGTAADPAYPADGENLLPVCTGERTPYDRTLFWRTRRADAARVGQWKYLKDQRGEHLYDLLTDPGEKSDLQATQTDRLAEIRQQYQTWASQMLPLPTTSG
jgi:arylsulfatase A-like enzyme